MASKPFIEPISTAGPTRLDLKQSEDLEQVESGPGIVCNRACFKCHDILIAGGLWRPEGRSSKPRSQVPGSSEPAQAAEGPCWLGPQSLPHIAPASSRMAPTPHPRSTCNRRTCTSLRRRQRPESWRWASWTCWSRAGSRAWRRGRASPSRMPWPSSTPLAATGSACMAPVGVGRAVVGCWPQEGGRTGSDFSRLVGGADPVDPVLEAEVGLWQCVRPLPTPRRPRSSRRPGLVPGASVPNPLPRFPLPSPPPSSPGRR